MKKRKIYWRRKKKEKKIIAEGKRRIEGKLKTIYLFTLPSPEEVLKSSLFPPEKQAKIMQKISRLGFKEDPKQKQPAELPTTNIGRTPESDATEKTT